MDVATFNYDYSDKKKHFFGFFSDIHHDSHLWDGKAFKRDIEEVIGYDGRIFIGGDLFSALLHKDFKRYKPGQDTSGLTAKLNDITDGAYGILRPYVDYIDYIGVGNHESSVVTHHSYDIVCMLAKLLNQERSKKLPLIQRGGYRGFLRLWFRHTGSRARRLDIFRYHGKGGGAPVTKGMIDINRIYTTYIADIYWFEHKHSQIIDRGSWHVGVDRTGKIYKKKKVAFYTAGYEKPFEQVEYTDNVYYEPEFVEEKCLLPGGIGCMMVRVDLGHRNALRYKVIT